MTNSPLKLDEVLQVNLSGTAEDEKKISGSKVSVVKVAAERGRKADRCRYK